MKHYYLLLFILTFLSCKKETNHYDNGSNEAINQWIRQVMHEYYYWNIPQNRNLNLAENPIDFFKSLLIKEDKFSSIVQNRNLLSYTNNFETTFGFDFIQIKNEQTIQTVISLVVPGSQADQLGLKRGDIILKFNDYALQVDVSSKIQELLNANSILVEKKDSETLRIASAIIAQPISYQSNILRNNNKTYGYLYLSHFNFAGAYDLINIINNFKRESIDELILDLRYNPGGQVSFAAFCAMLLTQVSPEDTFIKMKGNSKITNKEYSFAKSLSEQPEGYTFKPQDLKANSLNLKRIYILSSKQSASSSELMINNLMPYVEVIQVGETSMGKDMGSLTFSTPEDVSGQSNYKWIISPLVYKLYNADGKGDYSNGLNPQISVSEIKPNTLYPFGDSRDPLIDAILHPKFTTKATSKKPEIKEVLYRSQKNEIMLFQKD